MRRPNVVRSRHVPVNKLMECRFCFCKIVTECKACELPIIQDRLGWAQESNFVSLLPRIGEGWDGHQESIIVNLLPCLGKAGMGIGHILLISAPTSYPPSKGRKIVITGFLEQHLPLLLTLKGGKIANLEKIAALRSQ